MSVTRASSGVLHSAAVPLHSTAAAAVCDWQREEQPQQRRLRFCQRSPRVGASERPEPDLPLRWQGSCLVSAKQGRLRLTFRDMRFPARPPLERGRHRLPLVSMVPSSI
jgi:hypothetical protein